MTFKGEVIAHFDTCSETAISTRHQPSAKSSGHTGPKPLITIPPITCDVCGINGWVEASQWNVPLSSSDNIEEMLGLWYVPNNPSVNGGLIYFFNGIEPSNFKYIQQPVLQYGVSPAGGGNYWAAPPRCCPILGRVSTRCHPLAAC